VLQVVVTCLIGAMLSALLLIIPPRKKNFFTLLLALLAISTSAYGSWAILRSVFTNF